MKEADIQQDQAQAGLLLTHACGHLSSFKSFA
jgi:hypothetical protein